MYNSYLELDFLNNTVIKVILYFYGIIEYLNLVQHGLLIQFFYFLWPDSPFCILCSFTLF